MAQTANKTVSKENRETSGSSTSKRSRKSIGSQMDECIENCLNSYRACTELISHCLAMGGEHSSEEHISLLTTCASMSQTSATFMIYNSDYHRETCRLCSRLCTTCADDCERIAENEGEEPDQEMLDCAAILRKCAESCERMSAN